MNPEYKLVYAAKSVDAGWSSLVARRAHNPKVVGSNPAPATKFLKRGSQLGGPFCTVGFGFLCNNGAITPFFIGYRVVSTVFWSNRHVSLLL